MRISLNKTLQDLSGSDRAILMREARTEFDFIGGRWDPTKKAVLATFLAYRWRQFLSEFDTPDQFLRAGRDTQMVYLNHLLGEQTRLASEAAQTTADGVESYCDYWAAKFMGYYAVALIENDAAWERELAPTLDEILRLGWGISLGGMPLPGDERYFSGGDPATPSVTFSR